MAINSFDNPTARVGKIKGDILKHAQPEEVLGITGNMHKIGKNQSDTMVFRRWLPTGGSTAGSGTAFASNINNWDITAASHILQEGVTPSAETIAPQDITVQLNQYSCLYQYSDKTMDLYEDDIPKAQKKLTGQRMGLVRELIRYGALKGIVNKFYAGGTSRVTVDETITLGKLRAVSESIIGNRGHLITEILAPSPNYNTASVEAAFLVFVHSDCENDIREMPGFLEVSAYGSRKPVHPMELGTVDRYRFVISPELKPILASGVVVASAPTLKSAGSVSIDVYPYIVVGDDAWGDVALRGMESFDVTDLPPGKKDKSDPHGQRGYCGAKFWSAAFVQNDGWAAVIECGSTQL